MKNLYTEQQLKEKAQEIFGLYPNEKKVYATSDGNIFINENHAKLHAKNARVFVFEREEEIASDDVVSKEKLTAAKAIEQINAAEKVEDLESFKSDERVTVKKALEEKLKALNDLQSAEALKLVQTETLDTEDVGHSTETIDSESSSENQMQQSTNTEQ